MVSHMVFPRPGSQRPPGGHSVGLAAAQGAGGWSAKIPAAAGLAAEPHRADHGRRLKGGDPSGHMDDRW